MDQGAEPRQEKQETQPTQNTQQTQQNNQPKKIKIEETTIQEYFEVVQKEYEYERNKKQSFENRAGIVLTAVGGILVFILERVPIKEVFLTSNFGLKDLVAILVYCGFVVTFFNLYRVIKVDKHDTLDIYEINNQLMIKDRVNGTASIVLTDVNVIKSHRVLNNTRGAAFNKALVVLMWSLIFVAIYMNL